MHPFYVIQSHPLRHEMAHALAAAVGGAEVVVEPNPVPGGPRNPWLTYRECLARLPEEASHLVILQDDTEPATPDFRAVCNAVIAACPTRVIALYVGGNSPEHTRTVWEASNQGHQWAELTIGRWLPVVAAVYPASIARDILQWTTMMFERIWPASFMADDEIIGRYLEHHRMQAVAPIPCIVEHPDRVPSLLGKVAFAGAEPGRISSCPPPPGCDLRLVDWRIDVPG